jgi:predicted RNA-binding protein with PIN domain
MPYLIDGHNLIPKIPGLTLEDVDDEDQLLHLLTRFCQRQGKQVEVFFDKAPPGEARTRKFGMVLARFVRQGTTADEAIRVRLARLGRSAHNWTVVSSDQQIQAEARAARAHYISSEAFAHLLLQKMDEARSDKSGNGETTMDSNELDDWLKLFSSRDKD